jgi:hypothetical protein
MLHWMSTILLFVYTIILLFMVRRPDKNTEDSDEYNNIRM